MKGRSSSGNARYWNAVALHSERLFRLRCPCVEQPIAGGVAGGGLVDPVGLLLSLAIFGSFGDVGFTTPGTLTLNAWGAYFLTYISGGSSHTVSLVNFLIKSGSEPPLDSTTAVSVIFRPRNSGLTAYNAALQISYLNMTLESATFSASAQVNLINATVANFDLDPEGGVVFLNSDGAYSILGIRGVYVQPTSYIGDGNGPAGFYLAMMNGSVISNLFVFREAVYDVQL